MASKIIPPRGKAIVFRRQTRCLSHALHSHTLRLAPALGIILRQTEIEREGKRE